MQSTIVSSIFATLPFCPHKDLQIKNNLLLNCQYDFDTKVSNWLPYNVSSIASCTSRTKPQSSPFALQQSLKSAPISAIMCQIKSFSCPILAAILILCAVKIYGVVESASDNPFELFRGIWLIRLSRYQHLSLSGRDIDWPLQPLELAREPSLVTPQLPRRCLSWQLGRGNAYTWRVSEHPLCQEPKLHWRLSWERWLELPKYLVNVMMRISNDLPGVGACEQSIQSAISS